MINPLCIFRWYPMHRRFAINILSLIIVVIIDKPANRLTQMHVNHAPWRKHGFLVRISKSPENICNLFHPVKWISLIKLFYPSSDYLASFNEDLRVIIRNKLLEHFLRDISRHEFLPRYIVNPVHELLNWHVFIKINVHPVDHHWYSNRNTTQNRDQSSSLALKSINLVESFLLFFSTLSWLFLLGLSCSLWLFVCQPLLVDVNLCLLLFFLSCPNNRLQLVELIKNVLTLNIQELVWIDRIIIKARANSSFRVCLLELGEQRVYVVDMHLIALLTDNRQEVEQLGHPLFLFTAIQLTSPRWQAACFGHNCQSPVWRKVENVAVGLLTESLWRIWCLCSEGSLQILHGTVGVWQEQDASPRLNRYPSGHLPHC